MTKVLIIQNQIKFRNTLEQILQVDSNIQVVSLGINYPSIKKSFTENPPNVVVVESNPMDTGIKLVTFLKDIHPLVKVIVFTNSDFEENVLELGKLGVKSFLHRDEAPLLLKVIEVITFGGVYFSDNFLEIFISQSGELEQNKLTVFSEFELYLIRSICNGKSSTEIGNESFKSPRTIEDYRNRLYKKMGIVRKEQLIREAINRNII